MDSRRVGVLVDGHARLVDPGAAVFTAFDLAPTRGDGVFETLLVRDGQVRKPAAHLDRMARSAALMGIALPVPADWQHLIDALVAEPVGGEAALKLMLSRGAEGDAATVVGTLAPLGEDVLAQRRGGIAVVSLSAGLSSAARTAAPWLLGGVKSLSYAVNMAALRHARTLGADDAVLVSSDGLLLEGPTSTVVWVAARVLHTPPLDLGVLAGTTQAALFAVAGKAGLGTAVQVGTVADLHASDGAWLVSSVRGVAEIVRLDGAPRKPSPLTSILQQLTGIT